MTCSVILVNITVSSSVVLEMVGSGYANWALVGVFGLGFVLSWLYRNCVRLGYGCSSVVFGYGYVKFGFVMVPGVVTSVCCDCVSCLSGTAQVSVVVGLGLVFCHDSGCCD